METIVLAQSGASFVEPITSAFSGFSGEMMTLAGIGLVIGVGIVGIRKGFKVVKGMF